MSARFDAADIKRYYDRHSCVVRTLRPGASARFIAPCGGRARGPERTPSTMSTTRSQRSCVPSPSHPCDAHVVDLGCGVGSSLRYLAERLPIRGTGITLSPAQAAMARAGRRRRRSVRTSRLRRRRLLRPSRQRSCPPISRTPSSRSCTARLPSASLPQCHRLLKPGGLLVDLRRCEARRHLAGCHSQLTNS